MNIIQIIVMIMVQVVMILLFLLKRQIDYKMIEKEIQIVGNEMQSNEKDAKFPNYLTNPIEKNSIEKHRCPNCGATKSILSNCSYCGN